MSIKLMTMVWDRYPASGNEMLLALALADCAHDDGSRIWPSNETQAAKTRTSEATVKRLRATMQARGWLEVVRRASGRKGDTNEYRISAAWIAGGDLCKPGLTLSPHADNPGPVDNCPRDKLSTAQIEHDQGSNPTRPGLIAVTPESSLTIKEQYPLTPVDNCCGQPAGPALRPENRFPVKDESRPPWRWTEKRRDVERQGVQLGIGRWDEEAFARGSGERFGAYRARVQAATDARRAA